MNRIESNQKKKSNQHCFLPYIFLKFVKIKEIIDHYEIFKIG